MSKTVLYSLVMFALLLFSACGGDTNIGDIPTNPSPTEPAEPAEPAEPTEPPAEPPTEPQPPVSNDNSTLLNGPTIGNDLEPNDDLRKEISYDLTTPNPDFELGKAYAAVADAEGKDVSTIFFLEITNVSDTLHCAVSLPSITLKDAQGNTVALNEVEPLLIGNVVATAPEGFNEICLEPKATSYLLGLTDDAPFNQVTNLTIQTIDAVTEDHVLSKAKVTPQSYSAELIDEVSARQSLELDVKNEGLEPVRLEAIILLLDEDDLPLLWLPLRPVEGWNGLLEPGQTNKLTEDIYYEGSTTKLRAYLYTEDNPQ